MDFNFLALVLKASPLAQAVLLVLVALLYFCLWYILRKRSALRSYEERCEEFERAFWEGGNIELLDARARKGDFGERGLSQLFLFGQDEFRKACQAGGDSAELIMEGVRRALEIATQNEETYLNRHMYFLATVANNAPYIGLFGTVWGIINAFHSLTQTSQATIALVAPGIAEALVATAMGLLAAIPASIAFNYFSGRIERLRARFDNFSNHYMNILHRNL